MEKKAATEMTFDKIIIMILVILVILAIMLFLFKSDIVSKIQNIPGYGSNPDQTVNLTADQIKQLNYAPVGAVSVAVKSYSWYSQWYIDVYKLGSNYEIIQKIPTRLMLDWAADKQQSNGNLMIAISWAGDIPIGTMKDNRVTITVSQSDYLNYKSKYDALPDYADLIKLNDAKYLGGMLYTSKSILSSPSLNNIPAIGTPTSFNFIDASELEKRLSLADYKINLEPYFKPIDSNSFFYVRQEAGYVSLHLKNSVSDTLIGSIYPGEVGTGSLSIFEAVKSSLIISSQITLTSSTSKSGVPGSYQTNLGFDYTKLSGLLSLSSAK